MHLLEPFYLVLAAVVAVSNGQRFGYSEIWPLCCFAKFGIVFLCRVVLLGSFAEFSCATLVFCLALCKFETEFGPRVLSQRTGKVCMGQLGTSVVTENLEVEPKEHRVSTEWGTFHSQEYKYWKERRIDDSINATWEWAGNVHHTLHATILRKSQQNVAWRTMTRAIAVQTMRRINRTRTLLDLRIDGKTIFTKPLFLHMRSEWHFRLAGENQVNRAAYSVRVL